MRERKATWKERIQMVEKSEHVAANIMWVGMDVCALYSFKMVQIKYAKPDIYSVFMIVSTIVLFIQLEKSPSTVRFNGIYRI